MVTLPTYCLAPYLFSILSLTHTHTLTPSLTIPHPPLSAVLPLMKHIAKCQNASWGHFSSSFFVVVFSEYTCTGVHISTNTYDGMQLLTLDGFLLVLHTVHPSKMLTLATIKVWCFWMWETTLQYSVSPAINCNHQNCPIKTYWVPDLIIAVIIIRSGYIWINQHIFWYIKCFLKPNHIQTSCLWCQSPTLLFSPSTPCCWSILFYAPGSIMVDFAAWPALSSATQTWRPLATFVQRSIKHWLTLISISRLFERLFFPTKCHWYIGQNDDFLASEMCHYVAVVGDIFTVN